MAAPASEETCPVPPSSHGDELVLARGDLRVEITLAPFTFTVRRAGRRLLRHGGLWTADGTADDQFIQFTEGVIAREQLGPPERALRARVLADDQVRPSCG